MNASRCQGTNQRGGPCSATPQRGRPWCLWHDPERAEDRVRWNRDAGRAKSNRARARKKLLTSGMSLSEVDAALGQALAQVLDGELEPGVGTAAATIARAIVAVRQVSDLEGRVAALEAAGAEAERDAS